MKDYIDLAMWGGRAPFLQQLPECRQQNSMAWGYR